MVHVQELLWLKVVLPLKHWLEFLDKCWKHVLNYEQLVLLELVPGEQGTVIRSDLSSLRSWGDLLAVTITAYIGKAPKPASTFMFASEDPFLINSLLEKALRLWLGKGCERVLVLSGLLPLRNFSQFSRLPSKVARFVFSPLHHCLNSSKECCIQRNEFFPSKICKLLLAV